MKLRYILLFGFGVSSSLAIAESMSYGAAEKLFQQSRQNPGFIQYLMKFGEFNNKNRLDAKNNCYKLGGEVNLLLVLNKSGTVESVLTDVANSKSECFKKHFWG